MIEDMPAMAKYVSSLYEERMKSMINRYATMKGSRKLVKLNDLPKVFETVSASESTTELAIKVRECDPAKFMEYSDEEVPSSAGSIKQEGPEISLTTKVDNDNVTGLTNNKK